MAKFVRAYESGDVDALVALLTADVSVSMPPVSLEYHGRDVVARFYSSVMRPGRGYDLVPTRANGQLAFGAYLRGPTGGIRRGAGLLVLTLTGDGIAAMTRFDNNVLPGSGCHDRSPADHHGLPQSTVVQPEDHQQNGDLKAGKVVENYFSKLPDPADHPVFALTPAASHWVRQQQWG